MSRKFESNIWNPGFKIWKATFSTNHKYAIFAARYLKWQISWCTLYTSVETVISKLIVSSKFRTAQTVHTRNSLIVWFEWHSKIGRAPILKSIWYLPPANLSSCAPALTVHSKTGSKSNNHKLLFSHRRQSQYNFRLQITRDLYSPWRFCIIISVLEILLLFVLSIVDGLIR